MRRGNRPTTMAVVAMLVATTFATGALGAVSAGITANDDNLSGTIYQAEDGTVTVTVEYNGSRVDGALVTVEAVDNGSYVGEGEYTTDNGTVHLPAPQRNVTVEFTISYQNATDVVTADLVAAPPTANETENATENETDAFGLEVSAFVHELLASNDTSNRTVGQLVSDFVTAHNPGADHRPEWADPDGDRRGPPEDRGPDADKRRGPPEDVGPSDDDHGPFAEDGDDESEDDVDDESDDEFEEESDGEDEESEEDGDDSDDHPRGPPAHAAAD